jgi:D-alanyl-D-alanine endopeptidase (penicillin-binding protein 7)
MLKISMKVKVSVASSSIFEILGISEVQWSTRFSDVDGWAPPIWLDQEVGDDLWSLTEMDEKVDIDNVPRIRARAAFVYDLDRGEIVYEKDSDGIWPVASLTKTVAALTLASEGFDHSVLENTYCLDNESKPSLPGAKTKFSHKSCYSGWDLFGSALVSSDNGAALSFPIIANIPTDTFVEKMNAVASDLNMSSSNFVDSAGLGDENLSTARDMTKAIVAASLHPTVSISSGASSWYSKPKAKRASYRRNTTNKLVSLPNSHTLAAKTGFTFTADGCYSAVIEHEGRRLALTILGSPSLNQRWRDARKILNWVSKR